MFSRLKWFSIYLASFSVHTYGFFAAHSPPFITVVLTEISSAV